MLFSDYAVLVRRTSSRPPKITVERNIGELHRRVHLIECRYARVVRALQRYVGPQGGWSFRRNLAQAEQAHASIRIQRVVRGWMGWMRAFKRALRNGASPSRTSTSRKRNLGGSRTSSPRAPRSCWTRTVGRGRRSSKSVTKTGFRTAPRVT